MPLSGPWRSVGRTCVAVIGAGATLTPLFVWIVSEHETGWLIEGMCQLLVLTAVLARILHWKRVDAWLERIGLGRDDPPPPAG